MVDADATSGEWPAGGQELFDMIAGLVKFRALHPALRYGAHQPLYHQVLALPRPLASVTGNSRKLASRKLGTSRTPPLS